MSHAEGGGDDTRDSANRSEGGRTGSDDRLLYLGMGLTYLVAAVHLFHPDHGFPRLVEVAVVGQPSLLVTDPRPLAFTVAAVLLIVGANLVLMERWERPLYVAGVIVVAAYFFGYFAWHFTGHGGFLPGRQPIYHGLGPIENVVSHLTGDPIAALSKVLELALLLVLGLLYGSEEG